MSEYRKIVRVSHIGSSEIHDSQTEIGNIIVNFLIASKIDPNANVALLECTATGQVARSLYSFDPWASVGTLPGTPNLLVTCLNFESDDEKRKALEKLVAYLDGVPDRSYEDNNVMEKALFELERLPAATAVSRPRTVLTGRRGHYVPVPAEVNDPLTGDAAPGMFTPEDTGERRQVLYTTGSPSRTVYTYSTPSSGTRYVATGRR